MKLPNLITIMNREIQSNRTHTRPILHYRIQDTITSYSRDAEYQNTLFFFVFGEDTSTAQQCKFIQFLQSSSSMIQYPWLVLFCSTEEVKCFIYQQFVG
jgi:hypothetical protein